MRRPKVEVYQDSESLWRWRLLASNGRVVADGGESYSRRADCIKARFVELVPLARVYG